MIAEARVALKLKALQKKQAALKAEQAKAAKAVKNLPKDDSLQKYALSAAPLPTLPIDQTM